LLREYEASIVRRDRTRPEERAFWEPVLQRIEAEVARQLASLDSIDQKSLLHNQEAFLLIYEDALRAYAGSQGLRFVSMNVTVPRETSTQELRELANAYLDTALVTAAAPSIWPDGKGNLLCAFQDVRVVQTTLWMVEVGQYLQEPRIASLVLEQCQVEAIRRGRSSPAERAFWTPVLARVEAQLTRQILTREGTSNEPGQLAYYDASGLYHDDLVAYATSQGLSYLPYAPARILPAPQAPALVAVTIVLSKGSGSVFLAPWYRYVVRKAADGDEVAINEEFKDYPVNDLEKGTPAPLLGDYACYVKYDGPPPSTTRVVRKGISPDMTLRADVD